MVGAAAAIDKAVVVKVEVVAVAAVVMTAHFAASRFLLYYRAKNIV